MTGRERSAWQVSVSGRRLSVWLMGARRAHVSVRLRASTASVSVKPDLGLCRRCFEGFRKAFRAPTDTLYQFAKV